MTKLIMTLEKDGTNKRPEMIRVILKDGFYLLQSFNRADKWITQAEHKIEKQALQDAINWYA